MGPALASLLRCPVRAVGTRLNDENHPERQRRGGSGSMRRGGGAVGRYENAAAAPTSVRVGGATTGGAELRCAVTVLPRGTDASRDRGLVVHPGPVLLVGSCEVGDKSDRCEGLGRQRGALLVEIRHERWSIVRRVVAGSEVDERGPPVAALSLSPSEPRSAALATGGRTRVLGERVAEGLVDALGREAGRRVDLFLEPAVFSG